MGEPDTSALGGAAVPANALWRLWRAGQKPDVDDFLSRAGPLDPAGRAAVLRVDQRERWSLGERVAVEDYFRRHPAVRASPEAAVDLIHGEFLLRERHGERPDPEEYPRRFPEFAETLLLQIELHLALATAEGSDPVPRPEADDRSVGARSGERTALTTEPDPDALANATSIPPESFGRYRILRPIGRGSMGTVYLAHDARLDREVALKIPRLGHEPALLERFRREARIAATFHHPNLCPIYDVGEQGGITYLTMPLLKGETLADRLKRSGAFTDREAARLVARVARAMEVAHRSGIIHRDLKPSNLMLDERGEPVVMDFGLARSGAVRDAAATEPGMLLGTPGYSPPEQIVGEARAMGPTCDVYALGVILYELLTGRRPFRGTLPEVARQALESDPQPPEEIRPGLHPRLAAICLTALAKSPTARFATMAEFADALESYEDGPPSPAKPAATRPRRRAVVAGLIGLGLAAVGLVTLTRGGRHPGTARPPEALPVGSVWAGTFRFRGKHGAEPHPAEITVTSHQGETIEGLYTTEGGAYRWRVEGLLRGDVLRWSIVEKIRETRSVGLSGRATLEGRLTDEAMELLYADRDGDRADMVLRRVR